MDIHELQRVVRGLPTLNVGQPYFLGSKQEIQNRECAISQTLLTRYLVLFIPSGQRVRYQLLH